MFMATIWIPTTYFYCMHTLRLAALIGDRSTAVFSGPLWSLSQGVSALPQETSRQQLVHYFAVTCIVKAAWSLRASAMSSAIERALQKLDGILASAGSAPATAAVSKPLAVRAVPSASSMSESSSSKPSSSVNLPAAAAAAPAKPAAAGAGKEILATKAMIKVARITSAELQPNSAKLLKMQADLGDGDVRQIMAGLQQFYPDPSVLVGLLVCVAANLKPAKLAGEPSQAMVLAADADGPGGQPIVKPLQPPVNASPGDLVHLDGIMPPASYPKVLKLDDWKQVVPGLMVKGGKATYEGIPLVTSQGLVTLPAEIPDGAGIH